MTEKQRGRPKETQSSKQGRTMLKNRGQKFAMDLLWLEGMLVKWVDEEQDPARKLLYIRELRQVIDTGLPYMFPKLTSLAVEHEIPKEVAQYLKEILELKRGSCNAE